MALKTIEQQWEGFAEMVFRGMTPTPTQRREMQKAFFAGAWSMCWAMEEMGQPHVSEAEGVAYVESVRRECQNFKRSIMTEYAEGN